MTIQLPHDLPDKLGRLSLVPQLRIRGTWQGRHRSRQSGSSLEFSDYRLYTPGDDIRQLDWNAYGRTGKPFVRTYLDEQDMQVHLRLDVSASMGFGGETAHASKLNCAALIAACIGYIALSAADRVDAAAFGHDGLPPLSAARGKGAYRRLSRFLSQLYAEGGAERIDTSWAAPGLWPKRAGMTWIFSDFLYESGLRRLLASLRARKQEVVAVHILSPDEIEPALTGEVRLIDSERKDGKEVSITPFVMEQYRNERDRFIQSVRLACAESGAAYVQIRSDQPLSEIVFGTFRSIGLLK